MNGPLIGTHRQSRIRQVKPRHMARQSRPLARATVLVLVLLVLLTAATACRGGPTAPARTAATSRAATAAQTTQAATGGTAAGPAAAGGTAAGSAAAGETAAGSAAPAGHAAASESDRQASQKALIAEVLKTLDGMGDTVDAVDETEDSAWSLLDEPVQQLS